MGLTGANGFPCCDQKSVEIVDMRDDLNQHPFYNPRMVQEEEEKIELEEELLEQEPPPKANLDLDLDLELDPDPDPVPELELMALLKSELQPAPTPEAERAKWKVTNGNEDLGTQGYRIESVHPYIEGLPMLHNFRPGSVSSNTSYLSSLGERPVPTDHRSIPVQTSKHLFWANKFTQASEHSLQQETNKQLHKSSTDKMTSHQHYVPTNTLCSKKHFHASTVHTALPATSSQPPPSAHLSSSSLSPAIGLAELINFASSLALASSSKTDLPSLEHRIKAKLQKPVEPLTEPIRPATNQQELEKHKETLPKKPPKAREPQKTWSQEGKSFSHPYLDFSKLGNKRTTIEGEVKLLQSPATSPDQLQGAKEKQQKAEDQEIPVDTENLQKPRRLLTGDLEEEQVGRMQKGRLWLHTTQLTPMEPAAAMAWKAEQTTRRAREFKGPVATPSAQSGPDARSQSSLTDENLMPLTSRQLAAFQDIFKLFSSSPTGAVDMHSMKVALRSAGIQLSPREMCEALQQADLDGDGIVSFKDFLGVLTDNHRLAQCMGQVRNSCVSDPQGLQTLFFEMLFKLLRQGFVPSKSVQELKSYYSKKQQALRLDPGWRGRSRGHGCPTHAHVGLTFFCQAARVGGLSSSELARSLHRLYKAGPALRTTCSSASSRVPAPLARSPYAQIPNLEARRPPEHRTWSRASGPSVRLPKPYRPGRPKLPLNSGRLSQGSVRPWKLAPSPATLVQKQPFSPSPTCLQRPAVKSVN